MSRNGWNHFLKLQNVSRDGLNRLLNKRQGVLSTFGTEVAMDVVVIVVGLLIYIQFDVQLLFAIILPEFLEAFRPLWATVGLALVVFAGLHLLATLTEFAGGMLADLFKKIKHRIKQEPN
jgi:hypothetical protein